MLALTVVAVKMWSDADSDDDDGQDGESSHSEEEDDADADADVPRMSKWVVDETLSECPAEEDSEGTDGDGTGKMYKCGPLRTTYRQPPKSLATDKAKGKQDMKYNLELSKRPHKHAPTDISSKRPVTWRRTVVKDTRPHRFLSDLHTGNLAALRTDYKRARKLLRAAPEEEVQRKPGDPD
ncbi:hypothetical protein SCLCIDRAFT_10660 [Scleroderma citrinum Foug A]|uniref:Uncharacterized protein n=1 Tax=Scleroderma citrinum Foug A TaxID=1036808 RepID=A0A0C3D7R1_9AGAM|nr:hypothetical protein SCLCIDRAFT_10660 [Scleroderma citrinum Foug A]